MDLALENEQLNNQALRIQQNEARRKQAKDQLVNQATDAVKKQAVQVGKQAVLRTINLAFAATVVGLLITWVIMSIQVFVGNLLGVKTIALSGVEIGIWAILSFLLLMCFIIIFSLLAFATSPWQAAIGLLQDAFNWILGD